MKRLLGLLLVMGMVGCGGGEAPQQTDGSIAGSPSDVPKPDVPKPSGKALQTLKGHTDWVYSVAFSPDGQRIVSGSRDKTLKIWDANSGQELQTLKARDGTVGPAVPSLLDRTSREPWSTGLEVGHQLP